MHIAIFSPCPADIALIARSLPAHDCQSRNMQQHDSRAHAHLLIVDVASAGAQLAERMRSADRSVEVAAAPILLLTEPAELARLTELVALAGDGLIDSEFKPLRRHAIAARVKLLLQRAYPEHDEKQRQQFGGYTFESPAHIVTYAGVSTALTKKEFALGMLLFSHLGRPLSRAYLQERIWRAEEGNALPTRTLDTHIARVRSKLKLKQENGFRLSMVYGYGYRLERLADRERPERRMAGS